MNGLSVSPGGQGAWTDYAKEIQRRGLAHLQA
jgi:hypothetical protein